MGDARRLEAGTEASLKFIRQSTRDPLRIPTSARKNMNNLERGWMYDRLDDRGAINSRFVTGVNKFIQFACSQQNCMSGNNIRCLRKKCHNIKYKNVETVRYHLLHDGFGKDYFVWKHQGKIDVIGEISFGNDLINGFQLELGYDNLYQQIILDAVGPNFNHGLSWKPYNNIESGPSHPYEPSIEEEHETLTEEEPNRVPKVL
ncbi:hypothetical protein CQW23_09578 [Capsicum baccatum]|uniref:Transposase-associated domain-containing protein n=1 Tax=Capsicum baccatum TaxID=33114 RepID=A0A2G2WXA7_CAPBA|nr:hypothetical protein CQW23_09578 [Capsicum baccatum]